MTADDRFDVQPGRRIPYTQLPDWVAVADIAPQARLIFWILEAHVNVRRARRRAAQQQDDREVWTSREVLADLLGKRQARTADPYIRQLEAIGAVTVHRPDETGLTYNVYEPHLTPPDGYTGPRSLGEYYTRRNVDGGLDSALERTTRVDQ